MFTDVLRIQHPDQCLAPRHPYRQDTHRNVLNQPSRSEMVQSRGQGCAESRRAALDYTQQDQHVAHPIQRPQTFSNLISGSSPRHSSNNVAEHMLRRKTPNGTLAAGYDGSPTDLDARPHASKHFLIPNPYNVGSIKHAVDDIKGHTDYMLSSRTSQSYAPDLPEARRQSHCVTYSTQPNPKEAAFADGAVAYNSQGVDSVLNQGTFLQHTPCFADGQHVPTVLQPMWPPCVGPTSSNNTGPYGPYWPDGAFEPYRPAPLRDPRYCQQMEDFSIKGSDCATPTRAWLPRDTVNRQYQRHEQISGSDHESLRLGQEFLHQSEPSGPHMPSPLPRSTVPCHPYNEGSSMFHDAALSQKGRLDRDKAGDFNSRYPFSGISAQCSVQGSNTQFKDKVLAWAHRIYLNLLAYLNQSRRNESSGQQPIERHFPSNVYPKPFRHSFPRPALAMTQDTFNGQAQKDPRLERVPLNSAARSGLREAHFTDRTNIAYDSTVGIRQSLGTFDRKQDQSWRAHMNNNHFMYFGQRQPQPRYTYSEPPLCVRPEYEQSPAAAATNAMEMLSRLCSESGWQWVDGMLLGGCLAYGLGDLMRALKWYSKVLDCDPKYKPCPLRVDNTEFRTATLRPSPISLQHCWRWGGKMRLNNSGAGPSSFDLATSKLWST